MAATQTPQPESTLTDRYQTTIPAPVREALGLSKRDKICYTIRPDGKVLLSRATQPKNDPILGEFLDFLTQDLEQNPQQIQAIRTDLLERVQTLVTDVEIDLDAPLPDEEE